ncbi:DNA-processing protein DprA [Pseudobutyrivibrio ruminis]|uniref:DNA-processing protein DprA n=1 Tax=Pseudobutyrivibrio ruminis TaxID=46206 RepID=UPI0026F232B9|nr:DNA-processing protein DprA [Pseudobutyrivibrio ruminis]
MERCDEETAWLAAMQLKGVGDKALRDVNSVYAIEDFIEALKLGNLDRLSWTESRKKKIIDYYKDNSDYINEKAKEYQDYCEKKNIGILLQTDNISKSLQENFYVMPPVLFYRGNIDLLKEKVARVAVIGARRCTRDGKEKAIDIASKEVSNGKVIVSGMAKGIDSYAHTAALKAGGTTIAVLGNGIDICYPTEHEELMETIIEKGLVISQFLPGASPRQYQFPVRNRLIAGLSEKVYVVEAARNSGTNTTVQFAKDYGIEVESAYNI